jgi:hypothetical protein
VTSTFPKSVTHFRNWFLTFLLSILWLTGLISQVINTTQGEFYTTIQQAIDEAFEGDEIEVASGVFKENLVITKNNLSIKAIGNATIEDIAYPAAWSGWNGSNMPGRNPVVFIKANGVKFERFKIRDYQQKAGSPYIFSVLRIEGDDVVVKNLEFSSKYDVDYLAKASYELIVVAKGNNVSIENNTLSRTKQTSLSTAVLKIERPIAPGDVVGNVTIKDNNIIGGPIAIRLNPNATITVSGNNISQVNNEGLWVALESGAESSGQLVFNNNSVSAFGGTHAMKVVTKPFKINSELRSYDMLASAQASNPSVSSWNFEWIKPVHNFTQDLFYTVIQTAIDAANIGDTIELAVGQFDQNINIDKRLTISGKGNDSTHINSNTSNTPTVTVSASGLSVSEKLVVKNLKITSATGSTNQGAGILVQSVNNQSNLLFEGLEISGNAGPGIAFNGTPIISGVEILNSKIKANLNSGIRIASAVAEFQNLLIKDSEISGNANSAFSYNPSGTVTNVGNNFSILNTTIFGNKTTDQNNTHELSFNAFSGNAVIQDVSLDADNSKSYGILFSRGSGSGPLGNVLLKNVTITGNVGKGALSFQLYDEISGVTLENVDVSGCIAPWGQVILSHTDADLFNLGDTRLKTLVHWASGGTNAESAIFKHITSDAILDRGVVDDCFQIEDQIVHKIDLANLGLARILAENLFVTSNSFASPHSTSANIQRAIDAAGVGELILVNSGIYNGELDLNKDNLVLKAHNGFATTTIKGGINGIDQSSAAVRFSANVTTLEGFTIDNNISSNLDGRAIAPMSSVGTTIRDNVIENSYRGIQGDFYGRPTGLRIEGNVFEGSVKYGIAGTEGMVGIEIEGNTFRTSEEGIGLGEGVGIGEGELVRTMRDLQTWELSGGYAIRDYRSSEVYVKGGKIGYAISHVNTVVGDVIWVSSGEYSENVTVNKSVMLRGPNDNVAYNGTRSAEAVIDGNISISAIGASFSGFEVNRSYLPALN